MVLFGVLFFRLSAFQAESGWPFRENIPRVVREYVQPSVGDTECQSYDEEITGAYDFSHHSLHLPYNISCRTLSGAVFSVVIITAAWHIGMFIPYRRPLFK